MRKQKVESEMIENKHQLNSKKNLILILVIILLTLWGITASYIALSKSSDLETSVQKYDELNSQISAIKLEANNKMQEAVRIKDKAQKFIQREEKQLQNVYGSLFYYKDGFNQVNGKFIKLIEIFGNSIKTTIQNNSSDVINPRFKIYLLNEYGFITGQYHREYSLFDESIKPGETRIDEGYIYRNYGEPVYYSVHLEGI